MIARSKPEPLPPFPGPWASCNVQPDAIVDPSDLSSPKDAEWYGGAFVCESVTRHRALILAAPEMLKALEISEDLADLVLERIHHSDPRVVRWGDSRVNLGWIGAVKLLRDKHHELRHLALAKAKGQPPPAGFVAS